MTDEILPQLPQWSSSAILALRGNKNRVQSDQAYAALVETELNEFNTLEDIATVFLTNRECPFRCLMCDLWKNTLDQPIDQGRIPEQIDRALGTLPPASSIKLYNSGNFFDRKAIPPADYLAIAQRVRGFRRVIVENHPRLCGDVCVEFARQIAPARLEIALGLETSDPQWLAALNKGMTRADFETAMQQFADDGILTRVFVLLKLPWMTEAEGIQQAISAVQYAFSCGAAFVSVIPTRPGNGTIDELLSRGEFSLPKGQSLEAVMDSMLPVSKGRVFADLWDVEQFFACDACRHQRITRLQKMNDTQQPSPPVNCRHCL